VDDFGEDRSFIAYADDTGSGDGRGISKSIMLHLGTVLRAYYDRLLPLPVPIVAASDPDAANPGEPQITPER
jgi:hypothetical protein